MRAHCNLLTAVGGIRQAIHKTHLTLSLRLPLSVTLLQSYRQVAVEAAGNSALCGHQLSLFTMAASPTSPVDAQTLFNVLQSTFSADPALRKLAEQHVAAIKHSPGGALLPLLQIVAEHSAPRDVRQAACITIKNVLKAKWDFRVPENQAPGGGSLFSSAEREQGRAVLLETLMQEQDTSLRDLLAEAVKEAAAVDYPQHWPDFLAKLVENIQTGDVTRCVCAASHLLSVQPCSVHLLHGTAVCLLM